MLRYWKGLPESRRNLLKIAGLSKWILHLILHPSSHLSIDENRHLQRQRHHQPAAATAGMARRVAARHRLPAGTQDLRRDLSRLRDPRARVTARSGTARKVSTASPSLRGRRPDERRRGLPAIPTTPTAGTSRRRRTASTVGSIYLPNGNPQPGPKFEYKLAWFQRLIEHAAQLYTPAVEVVLVGDYNVVPTDKCDIYHRGRI